VKEWRWREGGKGSDGEAKRKAEGNMLGARLIGNTK